MSVFKRALSTSSLLVSQLLAVVYGDFSAKTPKRGAPKHHHLPSLDGSNEIICDQPFDEVFFYFAAEV
jgi:hypothetical protein